MLVSPSRGCVPVSEFRGILARMHVHFPNTMDTKRWLNLPDVFIDHYALLSVDIEPMHLFLFYTFPANASALLYLAQTKRRCWRCSTSTMSLGNDEWRLGPLLINAEVTEQEAQFILCNPRNFPLLLKVVRVCQLQHHVLITYLCTVLGNQRSGWIMR